MLTQCMEKLKSLFTEWNSSVIEFCTNMMILLLITAVLGLVTGMIGV